MIKILTGDCREWLSKIKDNTFHCVVTSPPYWGLRDYKLSPLTWPDGWLGVFGLEPTYQMYVEHSVQIFREVRRVLREDGTLWLNLGDSYVGGGNGGGGSFAKDGIRCAEPGTDKNERPYWKKGRSQVQTLAPKNLVGVPWRVALALQADGWYFRSALPWLKVNPMPESCRDRPVSGVEYIFLLSKSAHYFYDREAVKRPMKQVSLSRLSQPNVLEQPGGEKDSKTGNRSHKKAINNQAERLIRHEKWKTRFEGWDAMDKTLGRNFRNTDLFFDSLKQPHGFITDAEGEPLALNISSKPYKEAHFATFPPKLVGPCILAGCPPGGLVLDPFAGSGTVGQVALSLKRNCVLIEASSEYRALIEKRLTQPL